MKKKMLIIKLHERRIKEDWKSFMHARIHKKERIKLTNVNHLCKN